MLEGMETTTVGSFPLPNTEENFRRASLDLIEAGVDFPCYPQLVDMNSQFLVPLAERVRGVDRQGKLFRLTQRFRAPRDPLGTEYGETFIKLLEEEGLHDRVKGLRACLTGPFTLACSVRLGEEVTPEQRPRLASFLFKEPRAVELDWAVEEFGKIVRASAKAYSNLGFDIVSIDEPMLSLLVGRGAFPFVCHDREFFTKILDDCLAPIRGIPCIHVCGHISPLLKDLLMDTRVKLMDHEFQSAPKNLERFTRNELEEHDKFLGYGVVETKVKMHVKAGIDDYVESLDVLKGRISLGVKRFGADRIVLKPDCGFGGLRGLLPGDAPYEVAVRKMKNLCRAVASLRKVG